jgi:hypothetical protein
MTKNDIILYNNNNHPHNNIKLRDQSPLAMYNSLTQQHLNSMAAAYNQPPNRLVFASPASSQSESIPIKANHTQFSPTFHNSPTTNFSVLNQQNQPNRMINSPFISSSPVNNNQLYYQSHLINQDILMRNFINSQVLSNTSNQNNIQVSFNLKKKYFQSNFEVFIILLVLF